MSNTAPRQASSEYDRQALVEIYRAQRKIPAAEQARLFAQAKQGSPYATDQLVTAHMGIVFDYVNAKRQDLGAHIAGGMEYTDLLNAGALALTKAVDDFNPAYGAKFETFAAKCVRNGINKEMLNQEDSIRIPAKPLKLRREIYKLEEAAANAGSKHYFSDEELANRLSATPAEIRSARYAPSVATSLDKQTATGDPLSSVIGDTEADENAERELENPSPEQNRLSPVEMAVNDLPEAFAQVIRCRYEHNLSQRDTAAELDRPLEQVQRQEELGLELLRKTTKNTLSADRAAARAAEKNAAKQSAQPTTPLRIAPAA